MTEKELETVSAGFADRWRQGYRSGLMAAHQTLRMLSSDASVSDCRRVISGLLSGKTRVAASKAVKKGGEG